LRLELEPDDLKHLDSLNGGELILAGGHSMPSHRVTSRFLAKMAIEAMAHRLLDHPEGIEYLVDERQLDPMRDFARRGIPKEWPYHVRRIYDPDRMLFEPDGRTVQTVHEFDLLVTRNQEWFFVFALFGVEFTINLGGPEIDGYLAWLDENGGRSPLYADKKEIMRNAVPNEA
jgi:hypothetical protein